jgi:hypothetical protein
MASQAKDIRGSLILTPAQAEFMDILLGMMRKSCRHVAETGMMLKPGPGNMYSDFVVTVKCSQDRRTCEVYRNRTGTLVFAMKDGKVVAADYEIDFVLEHMRRKFGKTV